MEDVIKKEIKPEAVIEVKKKQEINYTLLGKYIPKIDGGKIFRFDREKQEMYMAEYRQDEVYEIGYSFSKNKLVVEKKLRLC